MVSIFKNIGCLLSNAIGKFHVLKILDLPAKKTDSIISLFMFLFLIAEMS